MFVGDSWRAVEALFTSCLMLGLIGRASVLTISIDSYLRVWSLEYEGCKKKLKEDLTWGQSEMANVCVR